MNEFRDLRAAELARQCQRRIGWLALIACTGALLVGPLAVQARAVAAEGWRTASAMSAAIEEAEPLSLFEWRMDFEPGLDLDGDGAPDFVNPTGATPRNFDAYGSGAFHASRDGGRRRHQGVDYLAEAGQTVVAPISGFVTKIGYAYSSDRDLRFVELTNPALKFVARVFYVQPEVAVGDAVGIGQPIGVAATLQLRYPRGMRDHVHVELAESRKTVDPGRFIPVPTLRLALRAAAGPVAR